MLTRILNRLRRLRRNFLLRAQALLRPGGASGRMPEMSTARIREFLRRGGGPSHRRLSRYRWREHFVSLLPSQKSILEIGPFCNPIVTGGNVSYFDILDSAALLQRAREIGYPIVQVPAIDYVSSTGDLSIIKRTFSTVISAHCIEHQLDLILHLQQVAALLEEHGRYFLLIPDKRYCFDHFIAESTIAGIIDAHVHRPVKHRLASVLEHHALTTHNDGPRHWVGDHADADYLTGMAARLKHARAQYEAAGEKSLDVHAWQFTPASFFFIIETLHRLASIPLKPAAIWPTPPGGLEFCAILEKMPSEAGA